MMNERLRRANWSEGIRDTIEQNPHTWLFEDDEPPINTEAFQIWDVNSPIQWDS